MQKNYNQHITQIFDAKIEKFLQEINISVYSNNKNNYGYMSGKQEQIFHSIDLKSLFVEKYKQEIYSEFEKIKQKNTDEKIQELINHIESKIEFPHTYTLHNLSIFSHKSSDNTKYTLDKYNNNIILSHGMSLSISGKNDLRVSVRSLGKNHILNFPKVKKSESGITMSQLLSNYYTDALIHVLNTNIKINNASNYLKANSLLQDSLEQIASSSNQLTSKQKSNINKLIKDNYFNIHHKNPFEIFEVITLFDDNISVVKFANAMKAVEQKHEHKGDKNAPH